MELAGDLGRGGGVIDEDGALGHAGKRPVDVDGDLAQVIVVADAGESAETWLRSSRHLRG
jgi:hypothetical protein